MYPGSNRVKGFHFISFHFISNSRCALGSTIFLRGVFICREIGIGEVLVFQEISTGGVLIFGEYLSSVTLFMNTLVLKNKVKSYQARCS